MILKWDLILFCDVIIDFNLNADQIGSTEIKLKNKLK